MKTTYFISFLLLNLASSFKLPSNDWKIQFAPLPDDQDNQICRARQFTKVKSTWMDYGLTKFRGRSLWSHNKKSKLEIYLYNNDQLTDYLIMSVYIMDQINFDLPFFNKTAHTTFAIYKENAKVIDIKDYFFQPHVLLHNQIMTLTEAKGDKLIVSIKFGQQESLWIVLAISTHCLLKAILLHYWKGNSLLSLKLAIIGWDFQFHIIGYTISFQIIQSKHDSQFFNNFLIFIWAATALYFFLHLFIHATIQLEDIKNRRYYIGLMVFGYCSGLLLPINIKFVLYSLVLLIQIFYNIRQQKKYSIDDHVLLSYLLNVGFILCLKGCPAIGWLEIPKYQLCATIVLLFTVQYWILLQLQKIVTVQYRQITTGKKSTDLYKKIVITAFVNKVNRNCSICQEPLMKKSIQQQIKLQNVKIFRIQCIVQTSCNHFFHVECLEAKTRDQYICSADGCSIPKFEF